MIYEIEHIGADIEDYEGKIIASGDKLYINTKNIVSIETYFDSGYIDKLYKQYNLDSTCIGFLINGIKYPIALIENWTNDEKTFEENIEKASKYLDNIFNEIVEIMKKENS